MARRRMISQEMISDETFNSISVEAQNVFVRMLTVSDDCGVVPANLYRLNVLINTPARLKRKMEGILHEITKSGLGFLFSHNDEQYFAFKPASFENYQSYILKKATKSEYLRIPKEEYEDISKKFQESSGSFSLVPQSALSTVESRKQKVESRKQKEAVPGNVKEVVAYVEELLVEHPQLKGYIKPGLEANKFFDHFTQNGWVTGRARVPMKDWQAAVRNWLRNVKEWGKPQSGKNGSSEPSRYDSMVRCKKCGTGFGDRDKECPSCHTPRPAKEAIRG